jgi:hypothetical protein
MIPNTTDLASEKLATAKAICDLIAMRPPWRGLAEQAHPNLSSAR